MHTKKMTKYQTIPVNLYQINVCELFGYDIHISYRNTNNSNNMYICMHQRLLFLCWRWDKTRSRTSFFHGASRVFHTPNYFIQGFRARSLLTGPVNRSRIDARNCKYFQCQLKILSI